MNKSPLRVQLLVAVAFSVLTASPILAAIAFNTSSLTNSIVKPETSVQLAWGTRNRWVRPI
ncbi:hypothetical protein [Microcoleus sp. PH2017_22_RUC_O_B]|uniref:hypothetical protein n=1 Tax=Microcoleus sp. PH2017_22_RUC_O_B TaxID=2798833 RepID=UPI0025F9F70D|nr:hypothetical protein [Microcoleus sp. PH2017_22_RUC_O_B]